jgi:transketolase
VNGHDVAALQQTLHALPIEKNKPTAIICHTVKGKGIHFAEHNPHWHHKSHLNEATLKELYEAVEK